MFALEKSPDRESFTFRISPCTKNNTLFKICNFNTVKLLSAQLEENSRGQLYKTLNYDFTSHRVVKT